MVPILTLNYDKSKFLFHINDNNLTITQQKSNKVNVITTHTSYPYELQKDQNPYKYIDTHISFTTYYPHWKGNVPASARGFCTDIMNAKTSIECQYKIAGSIITCIKYEKININNYDFIIHAPVYYEDAPPNSNKETTLTSLISKEFSIKPIYNICKKDEDFSMKGLNKRERFDKADKHFVLTKYVYEQDLTGKSILIVDDVKTTFATSYTLVKQLREKFSIGKILFLTAGRGPF